MAAGNFFGGEFFGGGFFGVNVTGKTGTGGIDPGEGLRRAPFKPTGLIDKPRKVGRQDVADRVEDARRIEAEIAGRLSKEFGDETLRLRKSVEQLEIARMTQAEISFEIGVLLRKRMRLQSEDEIFLLLLMAASG